MFIIRRLLSFWFIIVCACIGAYLLLYNQESTYVHLHGIGEFKVMSAIAFIACFLLGVTAVTLFFIFDFLKKIYEIRRLKKRVGYLERELQKNTKLGASDDQLSTSSSSYKSI